MIYKIIAAMTACALSSVAAFAADKTCPLFSQQELAKAIGSDTLKLAQAHAAGTCTWFVDETNTLTVHTIKRPNTKEAAELFDGYVTQAFAGYTEGVSHPKVGDKAFVGASGPSAPMKGAGMMILKADTVMSVTYYINDGSDPKSWLEGIKNVGSLSLSNIAKADQAFGSCRWTPPAEIEKLLGKKGVTIHRLGDDQCIVYVQPSDGVITTMGDMDTDEQTLGYTLESVKERCKTQMLPYLGAGAHAYYDCEAPANPVMAVEMVGNGRHMSVVYQPNKRAATPQDLEAMKPLLQHIYKSL